MKEWQKMNFQYFDVTNMETYEELKAAYLNEVKAEGKISDDLQQEFQQLKGYLFSRRITGKGEIYITKEKVNSYFEQFVKDWIKEKFAGKLTLTSVGNWVWIETKTREFADMLKNYGAKWSAKKRAWYWAPEGLKGKYRGKSYNNMGELVNHWGNAASDYFNNSDAADVALPF